MPCEPVSPSFASDNVAGALDEVVAALTSVNGGAVASYGADAGTRHVADRIAALFGVPAAVRFVFSGTGANVVALASVLASHEAVVCAHTAHLATDACGAPERIVGCKLVPVTTSDGKLRPADLVEPAAALGDWHRSQPRLVSVTQPTELGTLYRPEELAALSETAHRLGMLVHLDGARIANAVAAVGDLRSFTTDAGIDVVSFGGTKNGLLFGEAVVYLRPELARHADFVVKQCAQLPSKQRFVAAQFDAWLTADRWLEAAAHANAMAARLAANVADLPGLSIPYEVEANMVFAVLPPVAVERLQRRYSFHVLDARRSLVRWVCSFATTPDEVDTFAAHVAAALT